MKFLLLLCFFSMIVSGLVGCEESTVVIPAKKQNKTRSDAEKIFETEEQSYDDGYSYDPVGKRDPFVPLIQPKKSSKNQTDSVAQKHETYVPTEPLENFEISKIGVLGLVIAGNSSRALVLAPDGKNYVVRVGDRMGRNRGQVILLDSRGIHVRERYIDFSGVEQEEVVVLELPKREGNE